MRGRGHSDLMTIFDDALLEALWQLHVHLEEVVPQPAAAFQLEVEVLFGIDRVHLRKRDSRSIERRSGKVEPRSEPNARIGRLADLQRAVLHPGGVAIR